MTARLGANRASATMAHPIEPASHAAPSRPCRRPTTTATTPSPTAIITVANASRGRSESRPAPGHAMDRRPTMPMRANAPLAAPLPPPVR